MRSATTRRCPSPEMQHRPWHAADSNSGEVGTPSQRPTRGWLPALLASGALLLLTRRVLSRLTSPVSLPLHDRPLFLAPPLDFLRRSETTDRSLVLALSSTGRRS